jgi:hypothetical protein
VSLRRSWGAIDIAALQSNVPIASFIAPTVAQEKPSRTRIAVRFLGRWIVNSAVLALSVLAIAAVLHWIALGRWLLDGLMPDTVLRFVAFHVALCLHMGLLLTVTLSRIDRRGGARHG